MTNEQYKELDYTIILGKENQNRVDVLTYEFSKLFKGYTLFEIKQAFELAMESLKCSHIIN